MRIFLFSVSLFFASLPGLSGQTSTRSIHFGVSIIPQACSLVNGDKKGKSGLLFGYQFGPHLIKNVTNKLTVETGIHLQKENLKQRYHGLQWPSDVINGQWDPTRSYEQYEAKYFAAGIAAGLNLKMNEKENAFSFSCSAIVQRVIHFEDKLIINESGYFTDFDAAAMNNENNKTQFLIAAALRYDFVVSHKIKFSIGPSLEYAINDLLRSASPNLLWSYAGGHPLLIGIRFAYNGKLKIE